jgi:osmotically-inducible protein OsmY
MTNYNRQPEHFHAEGMGDMRSHYDEPFYDAPEHVRQSNEMNDTPSYSEKRPISYQNRNIPHDEQGNQYFGNLSDYERRGAVRFPESRIMRDQTGTHAGKGPKRSDERVREIICDRLCEDPLVDASDIEVTVKDCEVTLTGYVRNRQSKRRAEDIVEGLPGIKHLENRIHVNQQGASASQ